MPVRADNERQPLCYRQPSQEITSRAIFCTGPEFSMSRSSTPTPADVASGWAGIPQVIHPTAGYVG